MADWPTVFIPIQKGAFATAIDERIMAAAPVLMAAAAQIAVSRKDAKDAKMTTLLRLPEVLARTQLSRSKLYQLLDAGKFPRPIKVGDRVNAWADTEIEEWIQQQLAARDQ